MRYSLVVLSLAALAACNKGPEINVKNASVGEVAEKVREAGSDGSFVDPGRWETKVSLLDIEVPGMPPQMAQQMKQTMGRLQDNTYATCLTDADVKKPKEDFFAGKNRNCRYDHFTMSGGKIDAALQLPRPRVGRHGDDHHRQLFPRQLRSDHGDGRQRRPARAEHEDAHRTPNRTASARARATSSTPTGRSRS